MAKTVFEVGDVVRLKSGSDRMTIRKIHADEATCAWFQVVSVLDTHPSSESKLYGSHMQAAQFHVDCLESA